MDFIIVSSRTDKLELVIDDDMTVGDVRGVIQAMLDAPDDDEVTMMVNGLTISDNEVPWEEAMRHCFDGKPVAPKTKIYCRVGGKRRTEMDRDVMRSALPSKESREEELNAEREQARLMEPMIEQMSKNPDFVENMLKMQPGLKDMMDSNPEVARQLRNPDTLKELMMSQLHPDRRRDMGRSMELQLSQLSAIPGGQQMLERYTHGMQEDMDKAQYGQQSPDDLHETVEDAARPKKGQTSNSDALPNPWGATEPHTQPALPFGRGQPWPPNPYGFFPPGAPASGAAPDTTAANPFMNPALLQQFMSVTPPVPWGQQGPSSANAPVPAPVEPDYSAELALLNDMGFGNVAMNLRALQDASGDVEEAVLLLAAQAETDDTQEQSGHTEEEG